MTRYIDQELYRLSYGAEIQLDEKPFLYKLRNGSGEVRIRCRDGIRDVGLRGDRVRVHQGDCICGTSLSRSEWELVFVALENVELEKIDNVAAPEQLGSATIDQVFQWLGRLWESYFSRYAPSHDDLAVSSDSIKHPFELLPTERIILGDPQLTPLMQFSGVLEVGGTGVLMTGTLDQPCELPVCRGGWFECDQAATVRFECVEDLAPGRLLGAVDNLYMAAGNAVLNRRNRREREERLRLISMGTRERNDVLDLCRSFAAPSTGNHFDLPVEDELSRVINAYSRLSRIPLTIPHVPTENEFTQNLELIARASHTRLVAADLDASWLATDCGPLIGTSNENGGPVLLIRRRRPWQLRPKYSVATPLPSSKKKTGAFSWCSLHTSDVSRRVFYFVPCVPREGELAFVGFIFFVLWRFRFEGVLLLALLALASLSGFADPIAFYFIVESVVPANATNQLNAVMICLVSLAVFASTVSYATELLGLRIKTAGAFFVQAAAVDHVLRLKASLFRRFSSGDIHNRVLVISELADEIKKLSSSALGSSLLALVYLFVCFFYAPLLGWIALAAFFLFLLVSAIQTIVSGRSVVELELKEGGILGFSVQLIKGVVPIRGGNAELRAFREWCMRYEKVVRTNRRLLFLSDLGDIFSTGLRHISIATLYIVGAAIITSDSELASPLTAGTFLAFLFAFDQLLSGGETIAAELADLVQAFFKRNVIKPVLNGERELTHQIARAVNLRGAVEFSNVSFSYSSDSRPVLHDVSFRVSPGEFVAFVGPSGAGKSTLLRLLIGLEENQAGKITIDGIDLRSLELSVIREDLGVVLQEPYLPAGCIRDAIAGERQLSDSQVWGIASKVGVDGDIREMPMQMETLINEGGTVLSGGQLQRIMIARAIAGDPKLLLLDEATSSLDNATQKSVMSELAKLNVTCLCVAHRISTIQNADRIYVLDKGRVVQAGSFSELSSQAGLFQQLIQNQ